MASLQYLPFVCGRLHPVNVLIIEMEKRGNKKSVLTFHFILYVKWQSTRRWSCFPFRKCDAGDADEGSESKYQSSGSRTWYYNYFIVLLFLLGMFLDFRNQDNVYCIEMTGWIQNLLWRDEWAVTWFEIIRKPNNSKLVSARKGWNKFHGKYS